LNKVVYSIPFYCSAIFYSAIIEFCLVGEFTIYKSSSRVENEFS